MNRQQALAGGLDRGVDAAEYQNLSIGLELARVVAVERRDPPLHPSLLPEVGEVARDERDQERRAGDGTVDARHLGGLGADLFGDHPTGSVRPLPSDLIRPFQRRIAEVLRAKERQPLGDVFGVPVGDSCQPAPVGQAPPDASLRFGRLVAVGRHLDGRFSRRHPPNLLQPQRSWPLLERDWRVVCKGRSEGWSPEC